MSDLKKRQEEFRKAEAQAMSPIDDEESRTERYVFKQGFDSFRSSPEYLAMKEALELYKKLMANLMAKGNIDWGKTFGIDFGLMNEALIKGDNAISKAQLTESDYDPSPWCSACHAMTRKECKCGPIAENE